MGFLKKTEEESDDETSDDVYHKCTQREGTMEHPRTPFADKSTGSCNQHRFDHK